MIKNLNDIIGQKFNYNNKIITITKWKRVSSTYVIFTNKQTYNFYENELGDFLEELTPVKENQNNHIKLETMNETNQTVLPINDVDLKVVLLDTIKRVQKDKSYINQANAICNVVSQMINIKKLELQISSKK